MCCILSFYHLAKVLLPKAVLIRRVMLNKLPNIYVNNNKHVSKLVGYVVLKTLVIFKTGCFTCDFCSVVCKKLTFICMYQQ